MTTPSPGTDGQPGPASLPRRNWEAPAVACLLIAQVLALTVIGIFLGAPVWVAGLVMVLISRRWTRPERTRAYLVLGTGFPLALTGILLATLTTTQNCDSSGLCGSRSVRPWLAVALVAAGIAYAVLQVIVARRLLASVGEHGPRPKGLR